MLALGLVAACAQRADDRASLMTLAETKAWVDETLAMARAAADVEDLAAAVSEKCRDAGHNPGTLGYRQCVNQMEARMVALAKAGALARIGEALRNSPNPIGPLIGVQPEIADDLACYDRESKAVIGCQDI